MTRSFRAGSYLTALFQSSLINDFMKTRAILTAGLMAISVFTIQIYDAIYSPFTGATTAAQFDNSVSSYVAAKLIREGRFEQGVWLFTLVVLAIIWLPAAFKFF